MTDCNFVIGLYTVYRVGLQYAAQVRTWCRGWLLVADACLRYCATVFNRPSS